MPRTPEEVEREMRDWLTSAQRALFMAEREGLILLQHQCAVSGEKHDVELAEGVSVAIGQMREQVDLLVEIVEGMGTRMTNDSYRGRLGRRLSSAVSPARLEAIHRDVTRLPAQAEATP